MPPEASRFLQATDEAALDLACRLLGEARHASLGVLQPDNVTYIDERREVPVDPKAVSL